MSKKTALYDKDIREPLFDFLEERFGKVRIFEEKRMGGSRADIVLVTPCEVIGIEIKSDADSYARLARQVEDYDLYFDRNYVVVGSSHAHSIREHVPEHWGILTVELLDERADFYLLREAAENRARIYKRKLSMLWRPELAHIQEKNGMHAYKSYSKERVIDKILDTISEEILDVQLCEELFERDYSTIHETINAYRVANGRKKRIRSKRKKKKYRPIA